MTAYQRPLAILLPLVFCAEVASARFIETDDQLIDQEERYNTETYNDKFSYRFPLGWDRLYEASDMAVRVHAGSLNISRFDYTEEVKASAANESAGFGYLHTRHEDVLEQRTLREVRASGFFPGQTYLSMLADGGSFKEFGDVGWALGVGDIRKPWVELRYWSVDHFYDTKKSAAEDRRTRKTFTAEVKANAHLSSAWRLGLTGEFDHPLRWERPSRGYVYEYAADSASLRSEFDQNEEDRWVLALMRERKYERKDWYDLAYAKSMDRSAHVAELQFQTQSPEREQVIAGGYIDRRVRYVHHPPQSGDDGFGDLIPEGIGPDRAHRREAYALTTHLSALSEPRHYQQYGVFLNYVDLRDTKDALVLESKVQWAWEYRYTNKARVLLNTTWDTNQLIDDFPYDKRSFRPWGGGDIQFIAAF